MFVHAKMRCYFFLCIAILSLYSFVRSDDYDLDEPSHCEVCKYFVTEFQSRLDESARSKEVLRTGHGLDPRKKKDIKYATSELRLIEAMDGICEKIMEYNIHKERKGSLRFAKGMSETFKTLHGLKDKGVKVELGIPEEMWDEPSVEVSLLKKQCEVLLEKHEEDIEDWYFNHQNTNKLEDFLCKNIVLKPNDQECLAEEWTGKETKYDQDNDDKKNQERVKRKKKKKKQGKAKGEDSDSSDTDTEHKVKEEL